MPDNVKCCATCGFLTIRSYLNHELAIAHFQYRTSGDPNIGDVVFDDVPVCFRGAINLGRARDERRSKMQGSFNDFGLSLATIRNTGTDCDKHFPWYESLSIKDHVEMMNLERQEALYRKIERDNRFWNVASTVIGAIVGAVVAAALTLIAAS